MAVMEKSFDNTVNRTLRTLLGRHKKWFNGQVAPEPKESGASNLGNILKFIQEKNLPSIYIIIDEYDNFANQLITGRKDHLYKQLMADEGFLKTFFKLLKEGRKTGAIHNVFITGTVLWTRMAEGLKQEYPEADVSLHVIYCFGNQGYGVFHVDEKEKHC